MIFGDPGHPDQMPYIEVWTGIIHDQPKYLQECQRNPKEKSKPGVYMARGDRRNGTLRRPTCPVLPSLPETPPRLRRWRNGNPPPYSGSLRATAPKPDSTSGVPPGLLSLPHTRAGMTFGPQTAPVGTFPLREAGESDARGRPLRVCVPFTTSDLCNWKNQNPPFQRIQREWLPCWSLSFILINPLGTFVSSC